MKQRNMTLHKVSLETCQQKQHNFLSFYDQLSVCVFLDIITHSPRSHFSDDAANTDNRVCPRHRSSENLSFCSSRRKHQKLSFSDLKSCSRVYVWKMKRYYRLDFINPKGKKTKLREYNKQKSRAMGIFYNFLMNCRPKNS